jgi:hypothetical protein
MRESERILLVEHVDAPPPELVLEVLARAARSFDLQRFAGPDLAGSSVFVKERSEEPTRQGSEASREGATKIVTGISVRCGRTTASLRSSRGGENGRYSPPRCGATEGGPNRK